MRDYLNTYYEQETYKYKVKAFTCYTYYHAQRYVYESLRLDACPIYLVDDTAHFDYYNNATFQHYVTISYYNGQMQIMNILDPHYDDLYYGLHTITFDEFDFSASYDGWIIARTTDVSDDKYIYS